MLVSIPVPRYYKLVFTACVLTVLNACGGANTQSDADTPPAPTVSLTATPAEVAYNGQTSLSWSSTDSDSCVASGGWTGARQALGNEAMGPLTASTTFSLQCSGAGGSANRSVEVTVLPPLMMSFSADRTSVSAGESVTLSWSASAADSCTAFGDWTGARATTGQETVGPLSSDSTFTLSCDTATDTLVDTVNVTVTTPALSFTADRSSVSAGESVTLSWSAVAADSCTASGDWSGNKAPAGQETVGPLDANSEFTLSCRTATDTLVETVSVAVTTPVLSFMADRTSVDAGESVTLIWSSQFVTGCVASGDWSGNREPNGQETLGPLQADSAFTLTCSTGSGVLEDTVNVGVATTGGGDQSLEGTVDSSFIDGEGLNKVYIYAGDVQPDDYDGDSGDPAFSATVTQDSGGCTWRYGLASGLQDGLYTVAFTADAASDNPASNDSLSFSARTTLNIAGGSAVHDFVPANIIRVGPTRAYATIAQASQAASSGDVVEIDAGIYQDDISVWRQNNLTLRGINGRAHLRAVATIGSNGSDQQNGKGIIVARGDNMRFENLEFSGASVPDANGAGIRAEAGVLTICNSYFHDNENGILGFGSRVLIEYSEFDNNGLGAFGLSHNIYINNSDRFIFRNSYTHHANIGHNLKSRARENFILYSRLMDEVSGTSSYVLDLSNGGLSYVIGNLIQQGTQSENAVVFSYGAEGLTPGVTHRLYATNNSFVNDRAVGTFIRIAAGTELAQATNNLFVGSGTPISGTAQQTSNLQTSAPGFVDIDNYNYRLAPGSVAINAGTAPGFGNGYSLVPVEHYVHPSGTEPRVQSGAIDIGAYEYTP